MNLKEYEVFHRNEKCNIFADTFKRSVLLGYDSADFVKKVMTSDKLVTMTYEDERFEWCDECFLLNWMNNEEPFIINHNTEDKDAMWYLGWVYKYWMRVYNIKPREIYKIMPYEYFMKNFGFYHTQGEEYIIHDAINRYNRKNVN